VATESETNQRQDKNKNLQEDEGGTNHGKQQQQATWQTTCLCE
jgi:hypothetical protein